LFCEKDIFENFLKRYLFSIIFCFVLFFATGRRLLLHVFEDLSIRLTGIEKK
tara:strand:- start:1179 stop:1334 length:156 start_codon:yes stop_codon:yes gene_type:complete